MIFYGRTDQLICHFHFHCIKETSLFMEGGGTEIAFPNSNADCNHKPSRLLFLNANDYHSFSCPRRLTISFFTSYAKFHITIYLGYIKTTINKKKSIFLVAESICLLVTLFWIDKIDMYYINWHSFYLQTCIMYLDISSICIFEE